VVTDLNVAYIGTVYPHHARTDLQEIKDMGCTSINMCLNEADWTYYRFSRHEIRKVAKELGLNVYLNFHGFGSFASTFPGHMYQMKFPETVQISNNGKVYQHFACPNNSEYRTWLMTTIAEIIQDMQPDGVFWDEPRFDAGERYPEEWSCYCSSCRQNFELQYGKSMPSNLTEEVITFRQNSLLVFLSELSGMAKQVLPGIENILCLMPKNPWDGEQSTIGWYGVVDWEPFIALESIDVFATDPYWIHERDWTFFEDNVRDAIVLSRKYDKLCQLWVQAIWIQPGKEHLISETIQRAESMGADRIAVWAFRGESGSHALNLGAAPEDCWVEVVRAFKGISARMSK
jgi:hypothetical protein